MWFSINDGDLIGKKIIECNGCKILISDFKEIWYSPLSDEEILSVFKKLNPLLEVPAKNCKQLVLSLFAEEENINRQVKKEELNIILKLQLTKGDIKYQFEIVLKRGSTQMLYAEYIIPLFFITLHLQSTEKKLFDIINDNGIKIEDKMGLANGTKMPNKEYKKQNLGHKIVEYFPEELLHCIALKVCHLNNLPNCETGVLSRSCMNMNNKFVTDSTPINKCRSSNSNVKNSIDINHQIIKKRRKHKKFF